MKTALKFSVGLLSVVGMAGCGAASQPDVAEEGSVSEQSAALILTNEELEKGIRRDFNGDRIEDLIVAKGPNAAQPGSTQRLGYRGGDFEPAVWTRPDLSGNVNYTYGDFNGDHRTDVIITLPDGSRLYQGKPGGDWIYDAWVRSDLVYGNVQYVVGDYNNDHRSDLIVVTSSGSYEYLGRADGGFTYVWYNSARLGNARLTAGDFNGDHASDLIITKGNSSSLYKGVAGPYGGFVADVWVSTSYPYGSEFYPGDFTGDGKVDVIARNNTDARELIGQATGGFTTNYAWVHSEYRFGTGNQIQFIPGDYNGDGKWDLVIADGSGAKLYPAFKTTSSTGFGASTWFITDASAYFSVFKRGDFSGDGKDDLLVMENVPPGTPGTKEYKGQATGLSAAIWNDTTIVNGDAQIF
ncbi:MAG: VCBS repeat-containing protein [Pseudomonadota bacterium]